MAAIKAGRDIHALGSESVGRLLIRFSIPAMIAMLVGMVYNVTDRFFISRWVGMEGVAAVSITAPMFITIIAFELMTSVGGNALFAIRLGQGKNKEAARVLANTFMLQLILGLGFAAAALLNFEGLLRFLGTSDAVIPHARDYMLPITAFSVLQIAGMGMNPFIRTCGHPRRVMVNSVVGALLNVLLDYVFMAKLGMGITGAALGTVISQATVFAMVHSFFLDPSNPMRHRREAMRPDARTMWQIFRYGMSPFLLQLAFVVNAYITNIMLMKYRGDAAVSAYGIVNSIIMFVILPAFGITQAMQSIAGYNFGAKNWARLKQTLGYTLAGVNVWMFILSISLWAFKAPIIGMFDGGSNGADMIGLASEIAGVLVVSLPLLGVVFVAGTYLLATGRYMQSLAFNMVRQFAF
ncbi:MAG: MATE family efflux transporter, partial [Rickettsiales bacterium]|nr:MATE family efflux transporter [Rickettsiales bacterium]